MSKYKILLVATLFSQAIWSSNTLAAPNVRALEKLGKQVFFDKISDPENRQGCVSCHTPKNGWTSGKQRVNKGQVVVNGANGSAGRRKPPTIAYAKFSPVFGDNPNPPFPGTCADGSSGALCVGGLFADGRATGTFIGNEVFKADLALQAAYEEFLGPLADQALAPFASDVEQNVPDGNDNGLPGAEAVCRHVKSAPYARLYKKAWGERIKCRESEVDISFKRIAVAISAWEHSDEVNSFSSLRDIALLHDNDDTPGKFPLEFLTDEENLGHDLFYGISSDLNPGGKNALCFICHNSGGPGSDGSEPDQIYTDHTFNHLGIPPNYEIANFDPFNPDLGLSEHTSNSSTSNGHTAHYRTPTLRNVDQRRNKNFTKAYMHNGYFKSLEEVIHFYNTAKSKLDPIACPPGTTSAQAMARGCWPEAEINNGSQASNFGLFGNLGLSAAEEAALVAYMRTLTDYKIVKKPKRFKHRK